MKLILEIYEGVKMYVSCFPRSSFLHYYLKQRAHQVVIWCVSCFWLTYSGAKALRSKTWEKARGFSKELSSARPVARCIHTHFPDQLYCK